MVDDEILLAAAVSCVLGRVSRRKAKPVEGIGHNQP